LFARVAAPFTPDAAEAILTGLNASERGWPDATRADVLDTLARGAPIAPPDVLFKKFEDEDLAACKERFGGG
jgi:methionyl-tRNA synthetase